MDDHHDHPFWPELWLSFKRFVRWVIRPALFVVILLFVYDYGGENLVAEDRFVIIVVSLFAFIVVLLDMLDKDDPRKMTLVVGTAVVGTVLALAILVADHVKVNDQVNASTDVGKNLAEVKRIEAITSTIQDGMFLRVNADGSIEVVDSAELKRDHEIKLLNARVVGYDRIESALSSHVSREAVAQILSRVNINELLGVEPVPEQEMPLDSSDVPLQDTVEEPRENDV